jgi:hypothetical protein
MVTGMPDESTASIFRTGAKMDIDIDILFNVP